MNEKININYEVNETKAPTLDHFGDIDQALGWIFEQMYEKFSLEEIQNWWNSDSVTEMWRNDPDKLLRNVYDETK